MYDKLSDLKDSSIDTENRHSWNPGYRTFQILIWLRNKGEVLSKPLHESLLELRYLCNISYVANMKTIDNF